ncbi:MAG: hypothetical protein RLZZ628_1311 [Bacteroidota bacterium]|jgi:hypothetical protein
MKKRTLMFLMLCSSVFGFAQQKTNEYTSANPTGTAAQQDIVKLSNLYGLSALQVQDIAVIQQNKYANLAILNSLKKSNFDAYYEQYELLREGVATGVYAVLEESQRKIYRAEMEKALGERLVLQSQLSKAGHSDLEVKKALVELKF